MSIPTPVLLRPVLRAGELAYWDALSGALPCKVISIEGTPGAASSQQRVTFKLTANRGPWRRGEVMQAFGFRVVPRKAFFSRRNGAFIGCYTVDVNT